MVLKKWVALLNLPREPYFGNLLDPDHYDAFFYINERIEQAKTYAFNYFKDTLDFRNVMISGGKGSGKTSFIKYLKYFADSQPDRCPVDILILDLENYDYANIENLLLIIKKFLFNHFEKSKLDEIITSEIRQKAKNLGDDLKAILFLLEEREKYVTKLKDREEFLFQNLIIIADQVDLLGHKKLEDVVQKIFVYFNPGRSLHVTKCVCVRTETAEVAKKYPGSYLSTNFHRHIEIITPPLKDVLKKRFYIKKAKRKQNMISDIYEIFDSNIDQLISGITNFNLRDMFTCVQTIFENISPVEKYDFEFNIYNSKKKILENFFDLLLKKKHIQNLYKRLQPSHKDPIFRQVLEALSVYTVIDRCFYSAMMYEFNFTKDDVEFTLAELERFGLIKLEIKTLGQENKRYSFTQAGNIYLAMIFDKVYAKKCCKLENWPQGEIWGKKFEDTEQFLSTGEKGLRL